MQYEKFSHFIIITIIVPSKHDPSLEGLRALVEFAHAGSIAGAADRLLRTPSAITRQLQRFDHLTSGLNT